MTPEFVQKEAFRVIGMSSVGKPGANDFGALWDRFIPRMAEVPNVAGGGCYGICGPEDETGAFEYYAGLPVLSAESIPEGMVTYEVPAQTYAVFECPSIAAIGPLFGRIYGEWMPSSGYSCPGGPSFEFYPSDFDPGQGRERLWLYIPVVKA